MTTVVSGFPGVGKTEFVKLRINAIDSDSSQFSWVSEGVRHPDFPNNYMEHIKNNIGKVDYILVSSHDVVRDALREHGIRYTLVYPDIELQNEYLARYVRRGSPMEFVRLVDKKWREWIRDIESETFPRLVKLGFGQFLTDAFPSRLANICNGACNSDADDYCGMYMDGEECPACASSREKQSV